MNISTRAKWRNQPRTQKSTPFAAIAFAALLGGCNAEPKLATVDQIPELMQAFEVDGLAVAAVSGDEILLAEGFGTTASGESYTSNTSCGLFSATKVLASLTYANLYSDDRIDLTAPLGDYIADAPSAWADIPFYRLLNHTSGIPMVVNKPEFGAMAANPDTTNEEIYLFLKDAPLDYQPGEYSRYRQSGYAVGEMILSKKLGKSFGDLVEQYITRPAGMPATLHPSQTDEAQPELLMSAGGYETTANDMARLFLGINDGSVIDGGYWKNLMTRVDFTHDNYSLGNITETRNGVLTLGHRGGGARANLRYAPDEKVGVMVCTDDTQNNLLAISLANMLIHEITTGEVPLTPLLAALANHQQMTGTEVIEAYNAAAQQADRYDLSESESLLNMIGYSFLAQEQTEDAIQVFTLNTNLFPASANTYDSLAEATLAAGNPDEALRLYGKVLELDPESANAKAMIERIRARQSE